MKRNIALALFGTAVLAASAQAADENVALAVGESTTVYLDGNPTTGFLWSLSESPEAVKVEVALEEVELPSNRRMMVGCPRRTAVTITGVSQGSGEVKLVYARPWEKDNPPARVYTLSVTVN